MRQKFLLCSMVFMLTASWLVTPVYADRYYKSKEWRANKEKMIKKMHQELNISPEQEKQLNQHRERHRKDRESLIKRIQAKQEALSRELSRSSQDARKIEKLHNEIKMLKMKKSDHRLESIQGVRKILTPEQFEKFMQLKHGRK